MQKFYRSSGQRRGGTVRVTVELPAAVVDVLVAIARANYLPPLGKMGLADYLSYYICESARQDAEQIEVKDGIVSFLDDWERDTVLSIHPRTLSLLPAVSNERHTLPRGGRPAWWLKPGRGPKLKKACRSGKVTVRVNLVDELENVPK